MSQNDTIYDVMVIGSGFAGMAAAVFAAKRGLSVVQCGSTGATGFSTGLIDLMGVHPMSEGRYWDDPWAAIEALKKDCPQHPYARMEADDIRKAIDIFTGYLGENGLPFHGQDNENVRIATPAGTVKRTYRVSRCAWNGVRALAEKAPALIVDFHGFKGFSARQMQEMLGEEWPVKTARVDFPGVLGGELVPERMAWALSDPKNREALAEAVREHAEGVDYIGFPAVLGLYRPVEFLEHLEALTGKKVFEIPTLPPSIAGYRLRAAYDRGLPALGVEFLHQKMVKSAEQDENGVFTFLVGNPAGNERIRAKACILATGGFSGKGMKAERSGITEPLFGLEIAQPDKREGWHRETFFDLKGHPVNMAGIETDEHLRPLVTSSQSAFGNLFVAGAVLAHHDWARMKCGAGMAVATAYKAVQQLSGTK